MKKILAFVLCLMMAFSMVAAVAEEAAYSYAEYNYDETLFAEIGGDWIAMDGLGLVFYLPDIYLAAEVPEALVETGVVGLFGAEDGVGAISVAYGPAIDVEGNAAASIEALADYYTSIGATNVDVIIVNGIPVVTSLVAENDLLSYSVFFADSTQCVMSFTPASDANTALMGGLMITSLMAAEIVEE